MRCLRESCARPHSLESGLSIVLLPKFVMRYFPQPTPHNTTFIIIIPIGDIHSKDGTLLRCCSQFVYCAALRRCRPRMSPTWFQPLACCAFPQFGKGSSEDIVPHLRCHVWHLGMVEEYWPAGEERRHRVGESGAARSNSDRCGNLTVHWIRCCIS